MMNAVTLEGSVLDPIDLLVDRSNSSIDESRPSVPNIMRERSVEGLRSTAAAAAVLSGVFAYLAGFAVSGGTSFPAAAIVNSAAAAAIFNAVSMDALVSRRAMTAGPI